MSPRMVLRVFHVGLNLLHQLADRNVRFHDKGEKNFLAAKAAANFPSLSVPRQREG